MEHLIFAGDTFLKSRYAGKPCFSDSISSLFKTFDFCVVNLETAITDAELKAEKAFNFKSSSDSLKTLLDNNVRVVNIANNHTLDFCEQGYNDTRNNLDSYCIKYFGDKDKNESILLLNTEWGVKIGLAGFTNGFEEHLAKAEEAVIVRKVKELKKKVDYIIVCLHWGEEYSAFPSPFQQRLAHLIIDNGANLIIGHHPHVMQGYEKYRGADIYYSLGNFNFNVEHPYHERLVETKYSFCLGLEFTTTSSTKCSIIPIMINDNFSPEMIDDEKENSRVLSYLQDISEPLKKNISPIFWYSQSSIHHMRNNLPAWKKRIKEYGFHHFVFFIKWLFSMDTAKHCIGCLLYPFVKHYRFI